ncbi:uncharacterized protein LOC123295112 [Chrysoperla carnea]|uniref:uncharacterized protein LOC123295112 n=1 Tax=Chrysoperla carnea TaxID=189513 RepID=UPI001D066741|nr:uncharacterized protein LOC123295112 [Chrysoperla carnea]
MNDFFIQSQINGNGKKLMPLLKEHFTWMNTPVLNVLLELQKSSVQELSELNFLSKESGTQHFNTDMELLKLCTFINEIHFKTVHNQTEAERYEDLIKEEIFANIDQNSKQYEYLTLKCTEIGNMAAIKCFQIEAKQLGIVNDEHSIQLETLTKRLVEIQSDIDVKKELIEKYYAEIRPYFESCFETQQALNKRYSTFKFNVENAFTNLSNDNFQNHVETMKFIDFPLQFSINEYQNIKNCWKVLLNSSELENLNQILLDILNTPDTRPEIILIRLLAKKLNGSHETTNETTPFEDFNDLYTPEFFMDQNKELMIAESKLEFDSNSIELMSPKLEKLFEFWLRQNFKEVVSQSRFFDDLFQQGISAHGLEGESKYNHKKPSQ